MIQSPKRTEENKFKKKGKQEPKEGNTTQFNKKDEPT